MIANIRAKVLPTEDKEKVHENLKKLFPETEFSYDEKGWSGTTENLDHFRKLLGQQKIRDSAQGMLEHNYHGDGTKLKLNKQCSGKVNLYIDHELGPINLEIKCNQEEIKTIVWGDSDVGD